jgi:hypothetical protein
MAPSRSKSSYVVAREAVIVNVGGVPAVYGEITVTDRRTGDRVTIPDTDSNPVTPEDPGTPYTFKANQKVAKNHPAVAACPGAFIPLEDADEELVTV